MNNGEGAEQKALAFLFACPYEELKPDDMTRVNFLGQRAKTCRQWGHRKPKKGRMA